jgi:hypothetical protein
MKTRNKVLIGVAVIGIAYFLWDRSKKNKKIASVSNESNNLDLPTGMDLPNLTPSTNLPTEKAIKDSLFVKKPDVDPLYQQEMLAEQKRLDEQAKLSVLEKAKYAENERLARLAQEQYAKELAEYERQTLLEKQRLDKLNELKFLEEKRLSDERALILERERIANQERLFLMEEEIRNTKNQTIKDTSGIYEQRFYDGNNNYFKKGVELYAV